MRPTWARAKRAAPSPPPSVLCRSGAGGRQGAGAIMRRWFELILAEQETLAQIITAEQGSHSSRRAAKSSMALFYRLVRRGGRRLWRRAADHRLRPPPVDVQTACRRGRGDHAVEFPSAMFARKVGAALGAGCAMVLKPAEQTRSRPWRWSNSPSAPAFPTRRQCGDRAGPHVHRAGVARNPRCAR